MKKKKQKRLCNHQTDNNTFFRWEGLNSFLSMNRTPLLCGAEGQLTKGFTRSYKNLNFFWILGAGHFVSQNYTMHPPLLIYFNQ